MSQSNKPHMVLHASSNFFVCLGLNQTFSNIMKRSRQRSAKLNLYLLTILTKCKEHGYHVVVALELH